MTDTLCSLTTAPPAAAAVAGGSDLAKYLTMAMEMFFTLLDDPDPDIRQIADENLNRAIRHLIDANAGRVQVELYKELKKNGSSRCLRSALAKFSELAFMIRPQKCRAYVVNLLPCLIKMAKRRDEDVHEVLAEHARRLFSVIGKRNRYATCQWSTHRMF